MFDLNSCFNDPDFETIIDIEWFSVDLDGFIARFKSGARPLPKCVKNKISPNVINITQTYFANAEIISDDDSFNIDLFNKYIGKKNLYQMDQIKTIEKHDFFLESLFYSQIGLFSYESINEKRELIPSYFCLRCPDKLINIKQVKNLQVVNLLNEFRFMGSFMDDKIIQNDQFR